MLSALLLCKLTHAVNVRSSKFGFFLGLEEAEVYVSSHLGIWQHVDFFFELGDIGSFSLCTLGALSLDNSLVVCNCYLLRAEVNFIILNPLCFRMGIAVRVHVKVAASTI